MDKEQGFPPERQNTTDTVDTDETSDTNINISKSVTQTTKIADKLLWILGGWKSSKDHCLKSKRLQEDQDTQKPANNSEPNEVTVQLLIEPIIPIDRRTAWMFKDADPCYKAPRRCH
eukprot:scaffold107436_cov39-Cyclotella_meneghiniana.AAC.5